MIICDQCGEEYDAVAHRWRCPLCGWKSHCCEGEPQQQEPAGETPLERFTPQGWEFLA